MLDALPKSRGEAITVGGRYYYTGRVCIRNHIAPRRTADGKCLLCFRARCAKTMRRRRTGEILGDDRYSFIRHGLTGTHEMMLWIAAKGRAKKKGVEFAIAPTDIVIPDYCPVFGTKLDKTWGNRAMNNKSRENAPSLDRIDPRKGYVPGNVAVMSFRANSVKGDGLPQEHRQIAAFLESRGRV